jgi:pimeloyl-ACP methyl ester carboxylesterase
VAAEVRPVAVLGGDLVVELLPGETEPVLMVHGISSTRRLWLWLRAVAPEITLLAPDLRGRADSVSISGPFSLQQHADDLVAVLDAFGLESVHVCGMSMGGFVAVDLAGRYPERVRSLVLVDGGLPMRQPPGLTREALPQVFADRMGRLEQTWPSIEAYAEYLTSQTAPLLDPADPLLHEYLRHDLQDGRVRLSGEALLNDAADIFFSPPPIDAVKAPVRLLHAEWSVGRGSPPAYDDAALREARESFAEVTLVPGVDHAGSIMTNAGASSAATALTGALA